MKKAKQSSVVPSSYGELLANGIAVGFLSSGTKKNLGETRLTTIHNREINNETKIYANIRHDWI